ncbi:MAG: hypothetical protein M3Y56_05100, partial [Armatimonadota bacterium]|nr:hypothetical protein [Armatimonadota bacterium]
MQNTAWACLNDHDSDTLAHQAKQLPDVVRVITGRFERNPPLYYEMRISRETKDLQKDPTRLPLYDDVAVAYDRLHRDDEAIQWIEKKRDQLEHLSATNAEVHEHWYRYYANVGTFWAHRWLRSGADRTRIHEMEVARDYIAQALKLNPNAHFG